MQPAKIGYLPVFSPNREPEQGTTVTVKPYSIWCVSEDTTYQYDTWTTAVPIKAGMVRGVPEGVTSITFGSEVIVEIQE